jgi:hypothetical protein
VSGFLKRLVLSALASRLHRRAYRHGHGHGVNGLLREVHHLTRRHRYGHRRHYRYHGHYRHKHW